MPAIVLVADGEAPVREALVAALTGLGVADRVEGCDSGRSLVTAYARALRAGDAVAAVVLDVKLAAGGGKSSAIALRALEKAYEAEATGFVFHTASPRDANLDRVLQWLGRSAFRPRQAADPTGESAIAALLGAIEEVRAG